MLLAAAFLLGIPQELYKQFLFYFKTHKFMKKYEDLVTKYTTEPDKLKKEEEKSAMESAFRKKKNAVRQKYDTAVDALGDAQTAFEKAVVNPDKIAFDAEYLALTTAEATVKMYKDLYIGLFGDLPQ